MGDYGDAFVLGMKIMIGGALAAGIIGTTTIAGGIYLRNRYTHASYKTNLPVQQGYVAPKDLTVKVEDLDNTKGYETYIIIKDQRYTITYDEQERPQFTQVQLQPKFPELKR